MSKNSLPSWCMLCAGLYERGIRRPLETLLLQEIERRCSFVGIITAEGLCVSKTERNRLRLRFDE